VKEVVTSVRTVRAEKAVPPSRKIRVAIEGAGAEARTILEENGAYVRRLAGLDDDGMMFSAAASTQPGTVVRVVRDFRVHVDLAGSVAPEAERDKIVRELAKIEKEAASLDSKLSNSAFIERAPGEVVSAARAHRQTLDLRKGKLESTLRELGES
jgi:valyl-tRNA synthetase